MAVNKKSTPSGRKENNATLSTEYYAIVFHAYW